jgi:hypothetical protein
VEHTGGPPAPRRVNALAVAAGVVVGLIVFFGWMIFSFVLFYATDGSGDDTLVTIVLVLVVLALPLVLAVLLLLSRRTRQAGAGFVMGLAIGVIVFAGVCGTLLGLSTGLGT